MATLAELRSKLVKLNEEQLVLKGNKEQLEKSLRESRRKLEELGIDPDGDLKEQYDEIEQAVLEEGERLLERVRRV